MIEKVFPTFFVLLLDAVYIITLKPYLPQAFILLVLFQIMTVYGLYLIIIEPFKRKPTTEQEGKQR